MCIFCDRDWKDKTICINCLRDDNKLSVFHLLQNIEVIHNTKISVTKTKNIIDEYYRLIKTKTQKEAYRIIISKYD